MGIYLTYFAIGVATTLVGLGGFYLTDFLTDQGDDPESIDTRITFVRSIALFVAIVGFGGALFGGVGVLVGMLA